MKYVEMVQTLDGKLHPSLDDANRHANRCYGDELTKIVNGLLKIEDKKYTGMHEWIDDHLSDFENLIQLKQDMILEMEEQ